MDFRAKCRIIGIGKDDILPGELFQPRDDEHGRELVEAGLAEVYDPEAAELEAKEQAKTKLLGAIAAAQTIEELTALMPEEEPEEEIVQAFEKRMGDLDEDGTP